MRPPPPPTTPTSHPPRPPPQRRSAPRSCCHGKGSLFFSVFSSAASAFAHPVAGACRRRWRVFASWRRCVLCAGVVCSRGASVDTPSTGRLRRRMPWLFLFLSTTEQRVWATHHTTPRSRSLSLSLFHAIDPASTRVSSTRVCHTPRRHERTQTLRRWREAKSFFSRLASDFLSFDSSHFFPLPNCNFLFPSSHIVE